MGWAIGWLPLDRPHICAHTHNPGSKDLSNYFFCQAYSTAIVKSKLLGAQALLSHTHTLNYLILHHIIIPNAFSLSFSTAFTTVKTRGLRAPAKKDTHTHRYWSDEKKEGGTLGWWKKEKLRSLRFSYGQHENCGGCEERLKERECLTNGVNKGG